MTATREHPPGRPGERTPQGSRLRITVGLIVLAVLVGVKVSQMIDLTAPKPPRGKPVFDGDSGELKATKVVPTLDASIEPGVNTVWCASFLAAWKGFGEEVLKEPLSLQDDQGLSLALNRAEDPRPGIPEESLYVAAGSLQEGLSDRIRNDLARKFPAKVPPDLVGIRPDSFAAYAYLEAGIKFTYPYFQNREPLVFSDRLGKRTPVSSFGIRRAERYAYFQLRGQVAILFAAPPPFLTEASKDPGAFAPDDFLKPPEFAVDLDRRSEPNQIVLALVAPRSTLGETLDSVEARISEMGQDGGGPGLECNDVLLVPDMVWRISHRFDEIEGRSLANPVLNGQKIGLARQDIHFRLDRNGAELEAEGRYIVSPVPIYYFLDRPFLLYMKKRGAPTAYFAMWVENEELLSPWK